MLTTKQRKIKKLVETLIDEKQKTFNKEYNTMPEAIKDFENSLNDAYDRLINGILPLVTDDLLLSDETAWDRFVVGLDNYVFKAQNFVKTLAFKKK